jgi:hypothetical protein
MGRYIMNGGERERERERERENGNRPITNE